MAITILNLHCSISSNPTDLKKNVLNIYLDVIIKAFCKMFSSLVPKPGTVIKLPEIGTTVTYSSTTAESIAANGTKVTLHGLDLWSEFHKATTEMIITKAGR